MSENEIQVLEKGLDFAPIQRKIKKPELRKDFEGFAGAREPNGILGMSLRKTLA